MVELCAFISPTKLQVSVDHSLMYPALQPEMTVWPPGRKQRPHIQSLWALFRDLTTWKQKKISQKYLKNIFSNISCRFQSPNRFSNLYYNYSNVQDLKNILEQVKKSFCFKNCSFTPQINWSSDLKKFLKVFLDH